MSPSDFFSSGSLSTPAWILLAFFFGFVEARKMRLWTRVVWTAAFVILALFAWYGSAQQSADQRKTQATLDSINAKIDRALPLSNLPKTASREDVLDKALAELKRLNALQGEHVAALEAKTADRVLTQPQKDKITSGLLNSNLHCTVMTVSLIGDPDGPQYMTQFIKPIENGGWTVHPNPASLQKFGVVEGLQFEMREPNQCAEALARALRDAGFTYPVVWIPRRDLQEDVMLVVGNKEHVVNR
jgi:hypothetical protein